MFAGQQSGYHFVCRCKCASTSLESFPFSTDLINLIAESTRMFSLSLSPQSKNQLPIHILASKNTQTAFTGVQLVLKSGPKDLVLMKDGVKCSTSMNNLLIVLFI